MRFSQTSIQFVDSFGFGQGTVTAITLGGENTPVLKHAPALYLPLAAHKASAACGKSPAGLRRGAKVAVAAVGRCLQRLRCLCDRQQRWLGRDRMSVDMRSRAAFGLG